MTDQYPTVGEVVDAGKSWYWKVFRFLDENPGVMTPDQVAQLDVDLDDIIRRVEAAIVCENCERNPCRCAEVGA
ncbi:MAG TPA: hypothetical protein HA263_07910 [Methanoregulaceae archaeon]|nr:hypothetical protein [Methanoregulaceae archaeon]